MKKSFAIFAAILALGGLGVLGCPSTSLQAESQPTVLTQSNFVTQLATPQNTHFVLSEDIVLTNWTTIDIQGLKIDGAGFTITTDAPLFGTVRQNSLIENLGVLASQSFEWGTSAQNPNFGLLACNVVGSTFSSVFATCQTPPMGTPAEDLARMGTINVQANCSGAIGGMFGKVQEGAIIKDSFAKVKLSVQQNDENAISTMVGGFVGQVENATISNSYVVPMDTNLISASFGMNFIETDAQILVGGFVGAITNKAANVSNVFAGGALPPSSTHGTKQIVVGKLAGQVNPNADFHCAYTFNQIASINLLGQGNESDFENIAYLPKTNFTALTDFADARWDLQSEWDTSSVWCKTTEEFPVLQVFQSFQVSISSDKNSLGVQIELLDKEQQPILAPSVQDPTVFVPATKTDQKYNSTIYLKISIEEDFLAYNAITSLFCNNVAVKTFDVLENKKTVLTEIVVTGQTSGAYFASSTNLEYNLQVISDNQNQGAVYIKDASVGIDPEKIFKISYFSTQNFVAMPANNSYTFEKWVWVAEDQSEIDVFVGDPTNERLATKNLALRFGEEGTSNDFVYLFMTAENQANLPFSNSETKTFTLKAKFTTHNENISIVVSSNLASAEVFVGTTPLMGVEEIEGVTFTCKVTVGMPVQINLVVAEGYVFNGWRCQTQAFLSLVDTQNGENEMSTTIHVTPNGALTLYADVVKEQQQTQDLTWLWVTLGGIAGAALITGLVILIIRKKQNESFINYY